MGAGTKLSTMLCGGSKFPPGCKSNGHNPLTSQAGTVLALLQRAGSIINLAMSGKYRCQLEDYLRPDYEKLCWLGLLSEVTTTALH